MIIPEFSNILILRTPCPKWQKKSLMGPEICFTQQNCALNCTVYTRLEPMTHSIPKRMSSWEAVWLWLCPVGWSSSGSSSILSIAPLSLSLSLSALGCETVRMTLVQHPFPHCLLATHPPWGGHISSFPSRTPFPRILLMTTIIITLSAYSKI